MAGFDKDAMLLDAEAAGVHPFVIGYLYAHPNYVCRDHAGWDAVSRALHEGVDPASRGFAGLLPDGLPGLVPGRMASMFAAYCAEAEKLPEAAWCLDGDGPGRPPRLPRPLAVDLGYALCVLLVREVVARWAGPGDVMDLFEFLDENMQPEFVFFAAKLLADGHGLDMERWLPEGYVEEHRILSIFLRNRRT